MKFYFPNEKITGEHNLLQLSERSLLAPFDSTVLEFIQALSQRFIKMRTFPEIVALGYWMRKANLIAMKQQWKQVTEGRVIKARGTVFHIAPSNVDTIFIYSWMLSLLAGNRNIIRLSSKEQPQKHTLLQIILEELGKPAFALLADRSILLTYEHDDKTTAKLSELCHTRVVWGGNRTVNAVRHIPLAPMASELVFPDRFSIALIKAEAFNKLDHENKTRVVQQFYNDSYWFNQLACSSPRMTVWHGQAEETEKAKEAFWTTLEQVHREKAAELIPALQVQKLTNGYMLAAEQEIDHVTFCSAFVRVKVNSFTKDIRERHCGGGFFLETTVQDLSELVQMTVDKDQTLSYFGYEKNELFEMAVQIHHRGIDRIVPIGKALEFQEVWDGQSFLRSFTREILIQ